jgi:nucleotide-binding universal stress UspA family protein
MKTLVLTDFSHTSKRALEYTLDLLVTEGAQTITLAHVVSKASDASKAMENFTPFLDGIANPSNVTVQKEIINGDLYDAIGMYSKKEGFELIVFGTHGARGLQKVVGSHAVKLIQHTNCPVIVVQDEIHRDPDGIKQIALPLTLAVEDKKMLNYVSRIAKLMGAMVEVIYHEKTDEFLAATMKRNLTFTTSFLEKSGIEYALNVVAAKDDFDQQVISIAAEKSCDLIATINHHEDGIKNLFGWSFDQNMIENNAHIPVLTIDAKPAGDVKDIFSTTM